MSNINGVGGKTQCTFQRINNLLNFADSKEKPQMILFNVYIDPISVNPINRAVHTYDAYCITDIDETLDFFTYQHVQECFFKQGKVRENNIHGFDTVLMNLFKYDISDELDHITTALQTWNLMGLLILVRVEDIQKFIENTEIKRKNTTDPHVQKLIDCALDMLNIHLSIVNWHNQNHKFSDDQWKRYFHYCKLTQEFQKLRNSKPTNKILANGETLFETKQPEMALPQQPLPDQTSDNWKKIISLVGVGFVGLKMATFISKLIDKSIDDLLKTTKRSGDGDGAGEVMRRDQRGGSVVMKRDQRREYRGSDGKKSEYRASYGRTASKNTNSHGTTKQNRSAVNSKSKHLQSHQIAPIWPSRPVRPTTKHGTPFNRRSTMRKSASRPVSRGVSLSHRVSTSRPVSNRRLSGKFRRLT